MTAILLRIRTARELIQTLTAFLTFMCPGLAIAGPIRQVGTCSLCATK
jgi:hypothetical protein